MDRSQTPISPILEEDSTGHTSGLTDRGATCTPILNGPASIDMQHPPGQKIAKTGNGQKKQKLSVAQIAASQTFRAGLASVQAATNARWEKSREDKRARDARNDQVLQEERRMQSQRHDLELTRIRNDIMNRLTEAGEKLMDAVQKLEEFGHEPMLTPSQRFQYELRQEAVAIHKKQQAELKESLERNQVQSPWCMEPLSNSPTVGASQRKRSLDYAVDEVILEDD